MKGKIRSALFLDRDGVINKLVKYGERYDSPLKPDHIVLVFGIVDLIRWANLRNVPVVVVTNQPGVAKGKFDLEVANQINRRVRTMLMREGAKIDDFYLCPHHSEGKILEFSQNCECRKPKPGMLFQAAKEHCLNLSKSFLVGDRDKDIEAGIAAGCKTVLYYHDENNLEAIISANKSQPHYKVISHLEIIPILEKQLFS